MRNSLCVLPAQGEPFYVPVVQLYQEAQGKPFSVPLDVYIIALWRQEGKVQLYYLVPVLQLFCITVCYIYDSTPALLQPYPCATLYYWHKYTLAGTRTASTNVLSYL